MVKMQSLFIVVLFSGMSCQQAHKKKLTTDSLVNSKPDSIKNKSNKAKDTLNRSLSPDEIQQLGTSLMTTLPSEWNNLIIK